LSCQIGSNHDLNPNRDWDLPITDIMQTKTVSNVDNWIVQKVGKGFHAIVNVAFVVVSPDIHT